MVRSLLSPYTPYPKKVVKDMKVGDLTTYPLKSVIQYRVKVENLYSLDEIEDHTWNSGNSW